MCGLIRVLVLLRSEREDGARRLNMVDPAWRAAVDDGGEWGRDR
jgi:hypothetical protein